MSKRKEATIHVKEGSWYRLGQHKKHECCDCGLVHSVRYKIERGVVYEQWERIDRETNKVRKDVGIKVTRADKAAE